MKFHFDSSRSLVSIKLALENAGERLVIDAILDTGSVYTLINTCIAKALGCDPALSRRRVQITTASGMEICPIVTLESVLALGKKVNNLDILCHDLPAAARVKGLLGANFLSRFELIINYPKGTVELR